jgi:hypothetical protein
MYFYKVFYFGISDTKNSVGLVGCIDEVAHNAIAVYWNPLESSAKVSQNPTLVSFIPFRTRAFPKNCETKITHSPKMIKKQ